MFISYLQSFSNKYLNDYCQFITLLRFNITIVKSYLVRPKKRKCFRSLSCSSGCFGETRDFISYVDYQFRWNGLNYSLSFHLDSPLFLSMGVDILVVRNIFLRLHGNRFGVKRRRFDTRTLWSLFVRPGIPNRPSLDLGILLYRYFHRSSWSVLLPEDMIGIFFILHDGLVWYPFETSFVTWSPSRDGNCDIYLIIQCHIFVFIYVCVLADRHRTSKSDH